MQLVDKLRFKATYFLLDKKKARQKLAYTHKLMNSKQQYQEGRLEAHYFILDKTYNYRLTRK